MVDISFTDDTLILTILGLDQLWTFTHQLAIPFAHIRGVYANPTIDANHPGLRLPGAYFPGVITAGTFYQDGQRLFWDVHDPAHAIVIELHDERFDQLIVEVADPEGVVRAIWAALRSYTQASAE